MTVPPGVWLLASQAPCWGSSASWAVSVTLLGVRLDLWVIFSFSGSFGEMWNLPFVTQGKTVGTEDRLAWEGQTARGTHQRSFHACVQRCRKAAVGLKHFKLFRQHVRKNQRKQNKTQQRSFWKARKPVKSRVWLFANSGNPNRFWNVAGGFLLLHRLCRAYFFIKNNWVWKLMHPQIPRGNLNWGYFSQNPFNLHFSLFHWNNLTAKIHAFAPCPFRHPNTYRDVWQSSCITVYLGISEEGTNPSSGTEFPTFSKFNGN